MLAGRKYTFKTSADVWYSSSEWSQALVKTSNLCNVEAATFGHMTHTHTHEGRSRDHWLSCQKTKVSHAFEVANRPLTTCQWSCCKGPDMFSKAKVLPPTSDNKATASGVKVPSRRRKPGEATAALDQGGQGWEQTPTLYMVFPVKSCQMSMSARELKNVTLDGKPWWEGIILIQVIYKFRVNQRGTKRPMISQWHGSIRRSLSNTVQWHVSIQLGPEFSSLWSWHHPPSMWREVKGISIDKGLRNPANKSPKWNHWLHRTTDIGQQYLAGIYP